MYVSWSLEHMLYGHDQDKLRCEVGMSSFAVYHRGTHHPCPQFYPSDQSLFFHLSLDINSSETTALACIGTPFHSACGVARLVILLILA